MEVGDALAEGGDGAAQHLHPSAVFARSGGGQLEDVDVEQGRVVVVLDIVHHLAGLAGKAGALAGVVDLGQRLHVAVIGGHAVALQRAGQAHAHEVGGAQQLVAAARTGRHGGGVARVMQAVDPALALQHVGCAVAAATAAHGVAAAVAEAGNAAAVQAALRGLHEARAVLHFAKVPAFAEQVDVAAGGGVHRALQFFHGRARLVAHEVEAHAVDGVVARPDHRRVDHQLGHHRVLGGGVGAAGAVLYRALRVQALVVAGHDAVEHRLRLLAGGAGVVVDHVHAHAQAGPVQRLHHAAEFQHPQRAVGGAAGIAAFGRGEVQRVVAPVVAIAGGAGAGRGLLHLAVGRGCGQGREVGRGAALLGHGGEVEHRQQVHVGQAGPGQRLQVAHAVRTAMREGQVFAAVGGGHSGVAEREVAQVQLVDDELGGRLHGGWPWRRGPARGHQARVVEAADPTAGGIRVQAQ